MANYSVLLLDEKAFKEYQEKTAPQQSQEICEGFVHGDFKKADQLIQSEAENKLQQKLNELGFKEYKGKLQPTRGFFGSFGNNQQLEQSVTRLHQGCQSNTQIRQENTISIPRLKLDKVNHSIADILTTTTLQEWSRPQSSIQTAVPKRVQTQRPYKKFRKYIPIIKGIIGQTKHKSKKKQIKKQPKSRKASKIVIQQQTSSNNIKEPVIRELPSKRDEFGDLYELIDKKNRTPPCQTSHKNLSGKLYDWVKVRPTKLYRILTDPEENNKAEVNQQDWNDDLEAAFKNLMRKTHSFNSISKTKIFRQQKVEINKSTSQPDLRWKFDLHSPYAQDLDYQDQEYLNSGLQPRIKNSRRPISNILTSVRSPPPKIDQFKEHIKQLKEKTGEKETWNIHKLENIAQHIDKLKSFQQAFKAFQLIHRWENHSNSFNTAKNYLAVNILNQCYFEMKQVNKSRYSYISAKIAQQRAAQELYDKIMAEAEVKREKLRARQIAFQRKVTIARGIVKRLYKDYYKSDKRRTIITTQYPLGHPLFKHYMVWLGYLPEIVQPKPKKFKDIIYKSE